MLSCYTKLKDEAKIKVLLESVFAQVKEQFIQCQLNTNSSNSKEKDKVIAFDPVEAIDILSNAQYIEQALSVATVFQQHDAYCDLQVH